jgi:queuine/archaeosine tRNA-ribosyltransferase
MIKLTGLTQRQKQVIDLLWNCETLAEAQALVRALPTHRDRCDAQTLLTMVAWDNLEHTEGLADYEREARLAISRCCC